MKHRLLRADLRRRHQARSRAQVLGRATAGIQRLQRPAGAVEPGEDAAARRASVHAGDRAVARRAQPAPRADEHADRLVVVAGADAAARRDDAERSKTLGDGVAGVALGVGALDAGRHALAGHAVQERLGEGPGHRGNRGGRSFPGQVEPHLVPRLHLGLAGVADADAVEPQPPVACDPVDRRHARGALVGIRHAIEHLEQRRGAADAHGRRGDHRARAEVARDGNGD
jgi:hypothetical protein